ncbi:hypothetical protein DUNSADRAFT_2372 [Dunaliella salina]|uniref:Uncharacterized protein n=1 Tax=Dunaliella salina TaxID=3046 RepID=A0ABQ7FWE3_DUNSA|nr:hypothetical protein DUNSADRAFT_2372 [Dunaliella salina]|eukprot:KAF5826680.1 hypothetical protein DUNSADRAFT_2372 [Dunaliella salina]
MERKSLASDAAALEEQLSKQQQETADATTELSELQRAVQRHLGAAAGKAQSAHGGESSRRSSRNVGSLAKKSRRGARAGGQSSSTRGTAAGADHAAQQQAERNEAAGKAQSLGAALQVQALDNAHAVSEAWRGRKRARAEAADHAKQAAERRKGNPAAVRVRLVCEFLPLQRAVLLALHQIPAPSTSSSSSSNSMSKEEQDLQQQILRLKVTEVHAQLLDKRWTTEQLQDARNSTAAAANDIPVRKKAAMAARKGQQQQEGGQQQKGGQQQERGPATRSGAAI